MLLTYLRSDWAQKIDFWCNGIHVNGAGFMTVYEALASGALHVKVYPNQSTNIARYRAQTNTFYFASADYGLTSGERALMIHESIHAMTDIAFELPSVWGNDDSARAERYRPALKMLEEEVVCYITQALYILYETGSSANIFGSVQLKALDLATKIKDDDGATVTDEMQAQLKAAILASPEYEEELRLHYWSQADGVD
jgi:hypothetical protein